MSSITPLLIRNCPDCGKDLAPGALACPDCHALVHRRELDALAKEAQAFESSKNSGAALDSWHRALGMLPPESKQAEWIRDKIRALEAARVVPDESKNEWTRKLGPLAPVALLLVKSKGLLLAIFKLKFLFSFFTFAALYWALFGWRFGVGLAVSILIHELGHYIDIRRRGYPAEMPMFLPGLGAYVKWQALGVTLRQRAQVSLAGPLAGWLAAVFCLALFVYTGNPVWSALAHAGAMLNILNLIPVWILDGSQAIPALRRPERLALLGACLLLWLATGQAVFFLVAAGILWRTFTKDFPPQPSWSTFAYYAAVLGALGAVLVLAPTSAIHR